MREMMLDQFGSHERVSVALACIVSEWNNWRLRV